jgi:hypothetical protein
MRAVPCFPIVVVTMEKPLIAYRVLAHVTAAEFDFVDMIVLAEIFVQCAIEEPDVDPQSPFRNSSPRHSGVALLPV